MITLSAKKQEDGTKKFMAEGTSQEFKCWVCGVEVKEGYLCENISVRVIFRFEKEEIEKFNKVLCFNCQHGKDEDGKPIFNMARCSHNVRGEHQHIKFIRE